MNPAGRPLMLVGQMRIHTLLLEYNKSVSWAESEGRGTSVMGRTTVARPICRVGYWKALSSVSETSRPTSMSLATNAPTATVPSRSQIVPAGA